MLNVIILRILSLFLESRVNTTGMVQNIIEHESATYDTTYHVKSSIVLRIKSCLELH